MRLIRYALRHKDYLYLKKICLRVYYNVQNCTRVVPALRIILLPPSSRQSESLVPTRQSHYKETIISTAERTMNVVNIVSYSGVPNCALAVGFWIKNIKYYNRQQ